MRVREILDPRRVLLDVAGGNKREILEALAKPIVTTHPSIDFPTLVDVLVAREEASTTAIADGIAIPHGKITLGEEVIACFGRSRTGVDFESVDGKPTHIFFLLVSPESHPSLHLRWLAHLAVLLKKPEFRQALLTADTVQAVLESIESEEQTSSEER